MIQIWIYILGFIQAIGFYATQYYLYSALTILGAVAIGELLNLIHSERHTFINKVITIIITIITMVLGFGCWHYVKYYNYHKITSYNQQVIETLRDSRLTEQYYIDNILDQLDSLKYFSGSRLSTQQKLHNYWLDYTRMQIYIQLLPNDWWKNTNEINSLVNCQSRLINHFQEYRQYIKNCNLFVDPNDYDKFSWFAKELNIVKFIFYYVDYEYEAAEYLIEEHSGLRTMGDDCVDIAKLIVNQHNPEKLQELCRVYYNRGGIIGLITRHILADAFRKNPK